MVSEFSRFLLFFIHLLLYFFTFDGKFLLNLIRLRYSIYLCLAFEETEDMPYYVIFLELHRAENTGQDKKTKAPVEHASNEIMSSVSNNINFVLFSSHRVATCV